MHKVSTLNGSQWKGATNADDGYVFAVCTGDAVDRAKSSDTVRYTECAEAVDSCIRIGRVGCVELIAISDPDRFTPVLELLHESEIVIAWHTEDVPNTSFLQAAKQKVSNRLFHDKCLQGLRWEPCSVSPTTSESSNSNHGSQPSLAMRSRRVQDPS